MGCECGKCMCGEYMPQNYFNVTAIRKEDGTYEKAQFESSVWDGRSITDDGK